MEIKNHNIEVKCIYEKYMGYDWEYVWNTDLSTVKPLYSEQSRDPKNVHYAGVFTQEGWDMFVHTCAWNTMYTY